MEITIKTAVGFFVVVLLVALADQFLQHCLKERLDAEDRRERASYERYLHTTSLTMDEINAELRRWDTTF